MAKTKKLVRDKIPQIILNDGKGVEVRVLDWEEYEEELWKKFREEIRELHRAMTVRAEDGSLDWKQITIEAADVQEVFETIVGNYANLAEVREVQDKRRNARGGFDKRLYLERIGPAR